MHALLDAILDPSGFTPHGFCLLWDSGLIWLHAGSDALISLAYFSIPLALMVTLRRRRDVAFSGVFVLFAAFITACGTTHALAVLTLWQPAYWLEGGVKLVTAILSVATAISLWSLMPRAVTLPSRAMLADAHARLAERSAEVAHTTQRLRESDEHARISTSAPAKLFTVDLAGRILAVSNRCVQVLGITQQDAIGRPIHGFVDPASQEGFAAIWNQALLGHDVRDSENRLRRLDGVELIALVSLHPELDQQGRVVRVLGAFVDITKRRRAEEELGLARDRLRVAERMEAIGQLTGGISHDFNNMLAVVIANLDMIADDYQPGEAKANAETLEMVQDARTAAMQGASLIAQLLAYSRQLALEPRTIDLDALVKGTVGLLGRALGETIVVTHTTAPGIWSITTDPSQLENAILNLAINARDAMPDGGTLHLHTENVTLSEADVADLPDARDGDHVMLSITDSGVGMSPEVLVRAFEPFFTTKPAGRGTGLGLSMVYGFTRQSGGHLRLISAPGKGTSVRLFLPRARDSAASAVPVPAGEALPHGTERVLLVDDNDGVRMATARMLRKLGYQVQDAADAAQALTILSSDAAIDLLLTDVVMPGGMGGFELADAAEVLRPGIAVLLASGFANAPDTFAAPLNPKHVPLGKPFRRREFAFRVRAVLDEARVRNDQPG